MKLANEIALDLKRRGSSIGKPALIMLTIDELVLESIIAAKLEPVREAFESIMGVEEHDTINYAFDGDTIRDAYAALALLSKEV